MGSNIKASTLLLIFVTTTVAAQTFQYSRGWTNGKRAHKRDDMTAGDLERLSPCQISQLEYVLGKRSERLLLPCDYPEDDDTPRSYKSDRQDRHHKSEPQDPLFDSYL